MPYSICIIGNSHAAAIKGAWTNRAPAVARDVSLTFFSAGTHLLPHLELDDGVWIAGSPALREKLVYTSGGLDRIELKNYDAFVLIGTGFGLDVPKFCEGYGIAQNLKWGSAGTLLSRACFAATLEAWLESSLAMRMTEAIRSVSDRPLVMCAAPFLSEGVLEEPELRDQKRLRDRDFLEFFVAEGKAAAARVAERHGVELVWQDESTVGLAGYTKLEFGRNPIRFTMHGNKLPEFDGKHGNEEYGFLILTAALRKLDALSGGRVLARERKARAAE